MTPVGRSQLLAFDDSETAGADEALDVVGPVISWLLVASPFIGGIIGVCWPPPSEAWSAAWW